MDVSERTPRFWQEQLLHFMQKQGGRSQTEAAEQQLYGEEEGQVESLV